MPAVEPIVFARAEPRPKSRSGAAEAASAAEPRPMRLRRVIPRFRSMDSFTDLPPLSVLSPIDILRTEDGFVSLEELRRKRSRNLRGDAGKRRNGHAANGGHPVDPVGPAGVRGGGARDRRSASRG